MSNKRLTKSRLTETLGLVLIGDGAIGLFDTERHLQLWQSGPEGWRRAMTYLAEKPNLTRALSILEIGFGFWLATRQKAGSQNQ